LFLFLSLQWNGLKRCLFRHWSSKEEEEEEEEEEVVLPRSLSSHQAKTHFSRYDPKP
jgi:hypothetical protein